uniref:Uncharacterized protein n=1 Tax=Phlebotomus papatasi TaxID=29031 RepID=A0A1B0D298_PHLPP
MNPSIDIGSLGGSGWVKSICIRWEIVLEMQQKSTDTLPLMLTTKSLFIWDAGLTLLKHDTKPMGCVKRISFRISQRSLSD